MLCPDTHLLFVFVGLEQFFILPSIPRSDLQSLPLSYNFNYLFQYRKALSMNTAELSNEMHSSSQVGVRQRESLITQHSH